MHDLTYFTLVLNCLHKLRTGFFCCVLTDSQAELIHLCRYLMIPIEPHTYKHFN